MAFTKGHPFYKGGEKGWFKKGLIPWSKSQKGVTLNTGRTHIKKGQHLALETEFKKDDERIIGKNNWNWKGDDVGYGALHAWLYRNKGKTEKCIQCGSKSSVEWANKSHKYKRDVNDWIELCHKCYHKYDDVSKKIWETRRKNGTVKYKRNTV